MIITSDIKFYKANPSTGGLDLTQNEINKLNASLFPQINVQIKRKHIAYREIYIYNSNLGYELSNPVLSIVDDSFNLFSMAIAKIGRPLPTDADDIDVYGGFGPDMFLTSLTLPNIKAGEGVAIWLRRFIYRTTNETLYESFRLKLHGQTLS
jgi:hypothetical protein